MWYHFLGSLWDLLSLPCALFGSDLIAQTRHLVAAQAQIYVAPGHALRKPPLAQMRNNDKNRKKRTKLTLKKFRSSGGICSRICRCGNALKLQESTPFNVLCRFLKFQPLATHIQKVMTI